MSTPRSVPPAAVSTPDGNSAPTRVVICPLTTTFATCAGTLGAELLINPCRYEFIRHGCLHLFFEIAASGPLVLEFEGYSFDCLFQVIETLYYQDKNLTQARLRLQVVRREATAPTNAILHVRAELVGLV